MQNMQQWWANQISNDSVNRQKSFNQIQSTISLQIPNLRVTKDKAQIFDFRFNLDPFCSLICHMRNVIMIQWVSDHSQLLQYS